jgi:hypothetical protein
VTPFLWLAGVAVFGAAAYLVGWPAWTDYRRREARDLNVERYLAWRGRADRGSGASLREGMTVREGQRLWLAAGLAVLALVCLVAFFATS